MRHTTILPHLSNQALWAHHEAEAHPRRRKFWHLIWLIQAKGMLAEGAADVLGRKPSWASKWVRLYNELGPSAFAKKTPKPRNEKVKASMRKELGKALSAAVPEEIGGGLWSGPKVGAWLLWRYQLRVSKDTEWRLLKKMRSIVENGKA